MTLTDKKLNTLILAIEKLLNKEVAPVAPVLPLAPVAPVLPLAPVNPDDHNLLIRLEENVELNFRQVKEAIKELNDGTTIKLGDHEIRLRGLETRNWVITGGLILLSFISPYAWSLLNK